MIHACQSTNFITPRHFSTVVNVNLANGRSRELFACFQILLESKPYNDGQLWEEKRPIEEKPKSEGREKSSGGLFGKALRDTVRDEVEMRKPVRFGGNSAMDAVVAKSDAFIEQDDRSDISRIKLKKLCDQYRGKFPRIDGMRDLKDKSIAVLHFSAGILFHSPYYNQLCQFGDRLKCPPFVRPYLPI